MRLGEHQAKVEEEEGLHKCPPPRATDLGLSDLISNKGHGAAGVKEGLKGHRQIKTAPVNLVGHGIGGTVLTSKMKTNSCRGGDQTNTWT